MKRELIITCLYCLLFFLCTSCSTAKSTTSETSNKYVTNKDVSRETSTENRRDSIVYRDSIITKVQVRNDTIYITNEKIKYQYRELTNNITDTLIVERVDSVYVDRVKEVTITEKPSLRDRMRTAFLGIFIGMFLTIAIYIMANRK